MLFFSHVLASMLFFPIQSQLHKNYPKLFDDVTKGARKLDTTYFRVLNNIDNDDSDRDTVVTLPL